jgi:hypothetical protein
MCTRADGRDFLRLFTLSPKGVDDLGKHVGRDEDPAPADPAAFRSRVTIDTPPQRQSRQSRSAARLQRTDVHSRPQVSPWMTA